MQLKDMRKWEVEQVSIEGSTGGAPCYSMGGQNLSCVFPYDEDVEEARQAIHDVMYPVNNTKNKTEQQQEQATKADAGEGTGSN